MQVYQAAKCGKGRDRDSLGDVRLGWDGLILMGISVTAFRSIYLWAKIVYKKLSQCYG